MSHANELRSVPLPHGLRGERETQHMMSMRMKSEGLEPQVLPPAVRQRVEPSFLLGDIGGTNMRFWLVPAVAPTFPATIAPLFAVQYATASFSDVNEALAQLRRELPSGHETSIVRCTLAVCGPVDHFGRARCLAQTMGPGGWLVDEKAVARTLGLANESRMKLINDFLAVGLALPWSLGSLPEVRGAAASGVQIVYEAPP